MATGILAVWNSSLVPENLGASACPHWGQYVNCNIFCLPSPVLIKEYHMEVSHGVGWLRWLGACSGSMEPVGFDD